LFVKPNNTRLNPPLKNLEQNPTNIELGDYVTATRSVFVESNWYQYTGRRFIEFGLSGGSSPSFVANPVQVSAGHGSTTAIHLSGLRPGTEAGSVTVALKPYDLIGQLSSSGENVFVGCGVYFAGCVADFAVAISRDALSAAVFPTGTDNRSTANVHGIDLSFNASRAQNAMPAGTLIVGQPAEIIFDSKPIACSGYQTSLTGNNRTNSFLPTGVTGPAVNKILFYNGKNGDRPDLHDGTKGFEINSGRGSPVDNCLVVDGPSWHEESVVRAGRSLAQPGARHKLTVTLPPAPTGSISDNVGYFTTNAGNPIFADLSDAPAIVLNPNFWFFAANQSIDFLPYCAGKNLLPSMYASGYKVFNEVAFNSLPHGNGTVGCELKIQASCHAFAFTRKNVATGGLPDPLRAGWPTSQGQIEYANLPQPGVSGMELDLYKIYAPPSRHDSSHMLGAIVDLYFQGWFKISLTRLDVPAYFQFPAQTISCNWQVYRSPHVFYANAPYSVTERICIPLSNAQCDTLSDGQAVSAPEAFGGFNNFELNLYANGLNPTGDPTYVIGRPFGLQFSIPPTPSGPTA
jgi:hypothetical protein